MADRSNHIFGYTGPTPVGTGYARYLMVFDEGGLKRFVVRGPDGAEQFIHLTPEAVAELKSAL